MSRNPTGLTPTDARRADRHRPRRVAALVALVLGITSIVAGVVPAGIADAAVPAQVTVSKTAGIAETGETVTVSGTGFDPAAHTGTRPPLAGQPSGFYVTFGRYAETWRPSESAPSSAREALVQKWALPAAQRAQLDPTGTNPDFITLGPDGTFTTEFTIAPGGTTTGNYAIATYPASGATNADQETLTPITFGTTEPNWNPQVTVSKTAGIAETGETVTVSGTGFDPAAHTGTRPPLAGQPSGFYVTFGRYAETWRPSESAPSSAREALVQKWALPAAQRAQLDPTGTNPDFITLGPDGTFTTEFTIAPGGTTTGNYAIATYPASGATNADQETLTPITFATTTLPSPPPPAEPSTGTGTGTDGQTLTVTPFTDLDPDGQDITVEGEGFDPAIGIYVSLCVDNGPTMAPSPCVGGSGESEGSSSSAWITDDERFAALRTAPFGAGGSFSVELTVTAADEFVDCYDAATTCVLTTRADHTASANRSADVKVPVYFEGQIPPVDPQPEPGPDTTATIDKTEVVAGGEITVSGGGFLAGEQVQVWLHSEPQLMGVVVANALGNVTTTFTVPATTEPGIHHVELFGVTSSVRLVSPDFTVLAAAVPARAAAVVTPSPSPAGTTTASTGTLPVTGSSTLVLAVGGLLLVAIGIALAGPTRRRRTVGADT